MKLKTVHLLIVLLAVQITAAQSVAHRRAARLELGMNLTYLDNYWLGTKEKRFVDFVKWPEVLRREKMFADIARAGFRTVRIPICFSAWADLKPPYAWRTTEGLKAADLFVKWALANDLNVVIDLHHTEFDGSVPRAAETARVVSLWQRIAERYRKTDPEKVFFELRNEPHGIAPEVWRAQAEELIRTVRKIAPRHSLIVGFHDWNSRQALISSKPFADPNIIYTFHYYDPFIFTHQGATWAGEGLPELKNIPFPWSKDHSIETPATARGKWIEDLIRTYRQDSEAAKMFADLQAAKTWSENNRVPVFLGEFGSFGRYAGTDDRCRHAEVVYTALGRLKIPNAWWEWDGGFNMLKPGTGEINDCLKRAVELYRAAR